MALAKLAPPFLLYTQRSMTNRKLSVPATVTWLPNEPKSTADMKGLGTYRHFERLDEAVRFVMIELPIGLRQTAWIQADDAGGDLKIDEIEALYAILPPSEE
jgi:hypothetical protein